MNAKSFEKFKEKFTEQFKIPNRRKAEFELLIAYIDEASKPARFTDKQREELYSIYLDKKISLAKVAYQEFQDADEFSYPANEIEKVLGPYLDLTEEQFAQVYETALRTEKQGKYVMWAEIEYKLYELRVIIWNPRKQY